ncbi:MAG: choice-of-anchor D domain-containing protein, partial [Thermoanaerobaculia bacterium]
MVESIGDAPVTVSQVVREGPAAGDYRLERDRCSSRELEPGDDCSLRVAFAPAVEGERLAMLRVVSDAVTGEATIALSGDGLPAPEVALAPSRLQFAEEMVGDRSDPATLTFSNRGDDRLELGRAAVEGEGGYVIAEDHCSRSTLASGEECTIKVVFAPTAEGAIDRRLELPQAGGTGLSWGADMAGVAVAPRVEWSAGKLDWGDSRVGAVAEPRSLRLRNAGSGSLRVAILRLGGADAAAFGLTADGCTGRSLDPGASCDLRVSFRAARLGGHRAQLTVEGRGARGGRVAELAGSGVAGRIELSTEQLEFGSVRVSEAGSRELTLANTGNAELTLSRFSASGRAPGDYRVSGDCRVGARLAPGDSCLLVVRFSPQREGGRLATLEINHDGVGSPTRVPLSGAALAPPPGELSVEPARLDFGEVAVGGRSGIEPLTLSNTGRGRLRLREIRVGGRQPSEFQIVPGTCEGIPFLAPGGRCGIGVRFRPAGGGSRSATLTIRHDAPGGELRVSVSGLGLASGAALLLQAQEDPATVAGQLDVAGADP